MIVSLKCINKKMFTVFVHYSHTPPTTSLLRTYFQHFCSLLTLSNFLKRSIPIIPKLPNYFSSFPCSHIHWCINTNSCILHSYFFRWPYCSRLHPSMYLITIPHSLLFLCFSHLPHSSLIPTSLTFQIDSPLCTPQPLLCVLRILSMCTVFLMKFSLTSVFKKSLWQGLKCWNL